jgi:hypothetical protein
MDCADRLVYYRHRISNYQHTLDGFLAGLPYEKLLTALQSVNVNSLDKPILDLGF